MSSNQFASRPAIKRALIFFVVAFAILLYALSTLRTVSPIHPWAWSLGWIVAALIIAGALLFADVLVLEIQHRLEQRRAPQHTTSVAQKYGLDRRRFITELMVPTAAGIIGGAGTVGSTAKFKIFRETILLPQLPQALDGFQIGLITDPHIGTWVTPGRLARAVDVLNAEKVDLQILGGDLIDDLSLLTPTFAALERCQAPHGMLAILGNHEKSGHKLPPILDAYAQRKGHGQIQLIVDSQVRLEHRGAPLWVVGVDYPMHPGGLHSLPLAEHQAFMQSSADKAFQGVRTEEPVLCLSHHPVFFPVAAERGAWLTLAGHMHGGQWALFGRPITGSFPFIKGHYRLGTAQLYVSRGLGDWLPSRIGVPHEVTILTLARST